MPAARPGLQAWRPLCETGSLDRDRLGPVLYQLRLRWRLDLDRLRAFLEAAPPDVPQAVEFRDPSWYSDATFDVLERHGVALCLHDLGDAARARREATPEEGTPCDVD